MQEQSKTEKQNRCAGEYGVGQAETSRNLLVWQRAMQLSVAVYRATEAFPKTEVFGLTSQLRRASVSMASNIAGVTDEGL